MKNFNRLKKAFVCPLACSLNFLTFKALSSYTVCSYKKNVIGTKDFDGPTVNSNS